MAEQAASAFDVIDIGAGAHEIDLSIYVPDVSFDEFM